jgi:iron(III) transport system ATP-binding protein
VRSRFTLAIVVSGADFGMPVEIQLENITKRFGDLTVVDQISLTIQAGELFFLLGPSGCGKTTLLRCLAGFYVPEQGSIQIGDRDVTSLSPDQRDTGMVFQSYALWPHMTVSENVAFGLQMRKVPRAEIRNRVNEALEMVRMTDRADFKPNQLSGGQQQRVALARAMVIHPKCLLLDEPLSNLDAKLRLEMRSEIRRICKDAELTAVYVTHDQKEALSIADRVAVMHSGVLQQCGAPREVYRRPANRFVANFIGETNFIEGTVSGKNDGSIQVNTPLGEIVGVSTNGQSPDVGVKVAVSVRPEGIGLGKHAPAGVANCLDGEVHDSVYQGETAQHQVRVGETNLKVLDLNPEIMVRDNQMRRTRVWFDADDAVVLSD